MDLNGFDECEISLSTCNTSSNSAINLICTQVQIIGKLDACVLKGFSII